MKFRRRDQPPGSGPSERAAENPYLGLRRQFLTLGPEHVAGPIRGVALELGMAGGVATIVCVADGTTSFYTSTGGGYLGMGRHEGVRKANAAFLAVAAQHLTELTPVDDVPLPPQGEVNVVAVTADGLRLLQCTESEARRPAAAAHPFYVAGQDVVTQMRLVSEARSGPSGS